MAKESGTTPPKDHPALMPKLAWQEFMKDLLAESQFDRQYQLAEAIDIHRQTMSRWLGRKPATPDHESFEKVAAYLDISFEELAARWLSFMNGRYGAYLPGAAADSEVKEPATGYDEPALLEQAKAIDAYDLKSVPLEQRPFFRDQARQILELVAEIEELKRRLALRLRLLLRSFRQLYQSAVDTARKNPPAG